MRVKSRCNAQSWWDYKWIEKKNQKEKKKRKGNKRRKEGIEKRKEVTREKELL